MECSGSEYNLTECDVQNTGSTTSHSLDVGVKCQPGLIVIRASVDALCRDGAGLISRDRVQRGRLTRQGTTS